jgi:hypothetical protein
VSVLLNTIPAGSGTPAFAAQQTFATGNGPDTVAAADYNGDGRPDLAVGNSNAGTVSVLLNTAAAGAASPSFAAQKTFNLASSVEAVAAADLNGDGRPDLAAASFFSSPLSVLVNTTAAGATTPSFAAQQTFTVNVDGVAVAAGDLDGDGRPDLAVTGLADSSVGVLVNTTAAGAATVSFAAQKTFATGGGPNAVAVADYNGDGRPDLAVTDNSNVNGDRVSVLVDTTTPFASAVPVVVGQFGSQGVWEYSRFLNTWVQLTPANATRLAADSQGDVAAAFPGYGVQEYRPASGWKQINGVDATALAIDPLGDIAAEFPGFGVGEFLPASGWRLLTGANASLLAMDANGDIVGEFPGYGVWEFRPASGWSQLNGVDANLLAMDPLGDVVANFHGFGVGEFRPAFGWRSLNGFEAQALAVDARGFVEADFKGFGVGQYNPALPPASGWRSLTGADAALLQADAAGDVFGAFPGFGVWEFDPTRGWFQLTGADASVLAVA